MCKVAKKIWVWGLIVAIIRLGFLVSMAQGTESEWSVSEVMANPIDEKSDEFVEFYYDGETEVDLEGWSMADGAEGDGLIDFTGSGNDGRLGTKIEKGNVLLVVDADYAGFYNQWLVDEVDLSRVVMLTTIDGNIGNGMNNAGDTIKLINAAGEVKAQYVWDSDVGNGLSWENVGGKWVVSDREMGHSFGLVRLDESLEEPKILDEPVEEEEVIEEADNEYQLLNNIAEVDDWPLMTKVELEGVVSVDYNRLAADYLWIGDDTGGLGCKISYDPDVVVGDRVLIQGYVRELTYHRVFEVDNIHYLGADSVVVATIDGQEMSEYEDRLVKVSGRISKVDGSSWYIDNDGTQWRVYLKDGMDLNGLEVKKGDVIEVTGLVNEIKSGWRILPRSSTDILLTSKQSGQLLPSVGFDYQKIWSKIVNYFVLKLITIKRLNLGG
ncbi:MAG: lamin tail domain-containing protein [Patescibacteria group bacterium]